MSCIQKNKLYLVSTPIGNMKDITFRAIEILNEVDIIACEDTRRTLQLLNFYNIKKPLISYHEHNKYDKANDLLQELALGKNIALVTDAGTPIISDPGYIVAKEAIKNGYEITGVPGPCAMINALVISGLRADSFIYLGFLDDNVKLKKESLEGLNEKRETIIIYSSKSQIKKDIQIICEIFNNRNIAIAREMTKIHEEVIRGNTIDFYEKIKDLDLLGEFVVCIEGIDKATFEEINKSKWNDMSIKEHVLYFENEGFSEKDAIKKVAKERKIDKNEVYMNIKVDGKK